MGSNGVNIFQNIDTFQKGTQVQVYFLEEALDGANEPAHAQFFWVPEACHEMSSDMHFHTSRPLNAKESLFTALKKNFREKKSCYSYIGV